MILRAAEVQVCCEDVKNMFLICFSGLSQWPDMGETTQVELKYLFNSFPTQSAHPEKQALHQNSGRKTWKWELYMIVSPSPIHSVVITAFIPSINDPLHWTKYQQNWPTQQSYKIHTMLWDISRNWFHMSIQVKKTKVSIDS